LVTNQGFLKGPVVRLANGLLDERDMGQQLGQGIARREASPSLPARTEFWFVHGDTG